MERLDAPRIPAPHPIVYISGMSVTAAVAVTGAGAPTSSNRRLFLFFTAARVGGRFRFKLVPPYKERKAFEITLRSLRSLR
jgi:hypothetical protein